MNPVSAVTLYLLKEGEGGGEVATVGIDTLFKMVDRGNNIKWVKRWLPIATDH